MQAEAGVPRSPIVLWSRLKVTASSCHSQLQRGMFMFGRMSCAGQRMYLQAHCRTVAALMLVGQGSASAPICWSILQHCLRHRVMQW